MFKNTSILNGKRLEFLPKYKFNNWVVDKNDRSIVSAHGDEPQVSNGIYNIL